MDPCWVLVFLAITDCTVENGCLAVLPGSHREPFMEAEFDADDRHNALTRYIGSHAWRDGKRLGYTDVEPCRGLVEGVIASLREQRSLWLGGRRAEKLRTRRFGYDTFLSVGRVFRH